MQAAYDGVDRNIRKCAARKREDIDDACVATAGDDDEALRGVEHESLIFGNVVFHQSFGRAHLPGDAPVALGKNARHRAGKPCAGKYFRGGVVFDEDAAGGLIGFFDGNHFVVFAAGFRGPAVEDSFRDVGARKSCGICFHQFLAKRHQAADMIIVIVGENDFFDGSEIHAEFSRVLQHGLRARAGVYQDAVIAGVDEGGETPFADTVVGEHGGENGYLYFGELRVRWCVDAGGNGSW